MAPRQWAGRPSAEARVMATLATAGWLTMIEIRARLGYVPRAICEYKRLYRLRLDDPAREAAA